MMIDKNSYQKPTVDVLVYSQEDVIRTSLVEKGESFPQDWGDNW